MLQQPLENNQTNPSGVATPRLKTTGLDIPEVLYIIVHLATATETLIFTSIYFFDYC